MKPISSVSADLIGAAGAIGKVKRLLMTYLDLGVGLIELFL